MCDSDVELVSLGMTREKEIFSVKIGKKKGERCLCFARRDRKIESRDLEKERVEERRERERKNERWRRRRGREVGCADRCDVGRQRKIGRKAREIGDYYGHPDEEKRRDLFVFSYETCGASIYIEVEGKRPLDRDRERQRRTPAGLPRVRIWRNASSYKKL